MRDDNGWRWAAADDPPIIGHVRHSGYEFRSEPTGKRTVLAYPATRVPAAPSIRSLIGNESSARGLDTQVFHAVSARQVHVQHGDAISAKACTPKQAWNQYSTPGVSTKFPGIDEWKATFIYGRH